MNISHTDSMLGYSSWIKKGNILTILNLQYVFMSGLIWIYHWLHTHAVRAPVFGRHQFFGTSEHYGKAHGSLFSGWMIYNYTACCWFPTSSNILILPSQFWQIRFESCWLHCSKCRILVLLRYMYSYDSNKEMVRWMNWEWLKGCSVWTMKDKYLFKRNLDMMLGKC